MPAQRYQNPADQLANAEAAAALVLSHGSREHIPNDSLVFDANVTRVPSGHRELSVCDGSVHASPTK